MKKLSDSKNSSKSCREYLDKNKALNYEMSNKFDIGYFSAKRVLTKLGITRSQDDELDAEARRYESLKDSSLLNFQGPLDGVVHYLIWICIFLMPLFIPYFAEIYNQEEAPSLFVTALSYVISAPLLAYVMYAATRKSESGSFSLVSRIFLWLGVAGFAMLLHAILCNLGWLPKSMFLSKKLLDGSSVPGSEQLVWFSSFSNGKFFLTYVSILVATPVFLIQQYFDRDHLCLRLPLWKTLGSFLAIHLVACCYPLLHPKESLITESLTRIHQWVLYFILFVILCNSMVSLGRLLSIAKASALSGLIVAIVGLLQAYWDFPIESEYSPALGEIKYKLSLIMFDAGLGEHEPFSTFGHNNFSAAYVCLSAPITMALILTGLAMMAKVGTSKRFTGPQVASLSVWCAVLLLQLLYLTTSVGKAGILSMMFGLALSALVGVRLIFGAPYFWNFARRTLVVLLLIFAGGLLTLFSLSRSAKYGDVIDRQSKKWQEKLAKSFDQKQGSNRVRMFYVGTALSIMNLDLEHLALGVGPNNFKYHYPRYRDPEEANLEIGKHVLQAHCDYAQTGADLGILGLMAFSFMAIFPLFAGYRLLQKETHLERKMIGLGFFCTLASMACNSLLFFPFQTPGSLLPYFISLGLLFSYQHPRENATDKSIGAWASSVVGMLCLGFLLYESWFYAMRHGSWLPRLGFNLFVLLLGGSLVYLLGFLFTKAFRSTASSFACVAFRPLVLLACYAGLVTFSYSYSLTYLYTDYIKFSKMQAPVQRLENQANVINGYAMRNQPLPFERDSERANLTMAEARECYRAVEHWTKKAIDICDFNPDIYNFHARASQYFWIVAKACSSDADQALYKKTMGDYLSSFELCDKYWPWNRDNFIQLAKAHQIASEHDHENMQKHMQTSCEYSAKALKIWQNELVALQLLIQNTENHKRVLSDSQFKAFDDVYESIYKNSPFVHNDISYYLASYFDSIGKNDFSLDVRINDFMILPNRVDQILNLKSDLQKYNRNIIDLLYQKPHISEYDSLIDKLCHEWHALMPREAYIAIKDILLENGKNEDLSNLIKHYSVYAAKSINFKEESEISQKIGFDYQSYISKYAINNDEFVSRISNNKDINNINYLIAISKNNDSIKKRVDIIVKNHMKNFKTSSSDYIQ